MAKVLISGNMGIKEFKLPFKHHFDEPNQNGVLFDRDSFLKAYQERITSLQSMYNGIPVTTGYLPTDGFHIREFALINPVYIVGFLTDFDIDLTECTIRVDTERNLYARRLEMLLESGAGFLNIVGRYLGESEMGPEKEKIFYIKKLICFECRDLN